MDIKYLNLTNGLEYANEIKDYKVVRIQSTICEAKNWDKLIQDLDYNFLLDLAQGNKIEIYDTSSRKKVSRALFQGVEFIKYAINRRWFNNESIKAIVKGQDVTPYFKKEYNKLNKNTKKKLDYIKKFLNTDHISIETNCKNTIYDGKYDYYKNLLKEKKEKNIV